MELPLTALANEFVEKPGPQDTFPLTLQLCQECGHLQLAEVIDPRRLFGNYVYVSATSPVFVQHFEEYAEHLIGEAQLSQLSRRSLIVDIGSNDGTFLRAFKRRGFERVLGVEPAKKIAEVASTQNDVSTRVGMFTRVMALEIRNESGAADLVTANNVFAHADDLEEIATGVRDLLSPDGIFVFEVSYLQDVVSKMLFDTIYHEHLSYHTLRPLLVFFGSLDMRVFHAERVSTHGGSLRVYVSRARRPVSDDVGRLAQEELEMGLFEAKTYRNLGRRIDSQGAKLREQVRAWKKEGKRIAGYGAPAKLTTLMYAFGLDGADFEFIIDDSPWKQGLYTPGLQIPVKSKQEEGQSRLTREKIDVCMVFAWNFFDSIVANNKDWNGLFVNPLA